MVGATFDQRVTFGGNSAFAEKIDNAPFTPLAKGPPSVLEKVPPCYTKIREVGMYRYAIQGMGGFETYFLGNCEKMIYSLGHEGLLFKTVLFIILLIRGFYR